MIIGDTVKQSLVYVERGEVDAGFVFITDVNTATPDTIEIVSSVPVSETIYYPIAVVTSTQHPIESQIFVDLSREKKVAQYWSSMGSQFQNMILKMFNPPSTK
ncbi:MAG: molybdate transport system substrate-binding protein [Methanohalophilus sp.]|nr:molybdate transport system substrate-binding protein [Methanohalophilus sp.]